MVLVLPSPKVHDHAVGLLVLASVKVACNPVILILKLETGSGQPPLTVTVLHTVFAPQALVAIKQTV